MIARLLWMLARPGSNGAAVIVLPVVAFGVVTTLLLTVIGGALTFWSWHDSEAFLYQALAVVALVLLVVPLATLGGAAARLSARRRDERLSTLRLLGMTPAGVGAITVLESTVISLLGALAGVLGYLALVPLIGLIHFRGEALGAASVLLNPLGIAGVILAVVALAAVSAALGLRRVIISPLGVRTRQDAPTQHWLRVVIAAGVIAASVTLMSVLNLAGEAVVIISFVGGAFAATLAVLNLVGPWVLRLVASGQAKRAQTPERLLAARTVLESPKAAWRQVSGVAMTSFMAVFAGTGVAMLQTMGDGARPEDLVLVTDIRTGLIITVIASFIMVACSVGVNQAAELLDRRELYGSLVRLGMPIATMDAARQRAVMSPLRITALGSAACAAAVVLPLIGIAVLTSPLSLLVIAAVLLAGIALVWLGLLSTRPVLRRVAADAAA